MVYKAERGGCLLCMLLVHNIKTNEKMDLLRRTAGIKRADLGVD